MLDSFFTPKNIAVVGASRDPHKLGYGVLRNLIKYKFKGNIYPVNKYASEIAGLTCYPSVTDLPDSVDLVVIVVPAKFVASLLKDCGKKGIRHVIIISGGFKETGEEGARLEKELLRIAGKYNIRIIGPNCIGTIDTHAPLNSTFVVGMPEQGDIGFISQSGAMVAAVIDWATGAGVGFSRIVSLGNQIDVTEKEMIELIGNDRETKVVTTYAEGISDGKQFLNLASDLCRKKPFVILKGGRSEKGARAVISHTGALAGSEEAYSAAFKKVGALEATNIEEMFDWARALAWQPLPKGNRIAVLTNAGGAAILAVDAIEKAGLELSSLTDETRAYLKSRLPKAASVENPVDVLAGSGPAIYTLALEALLTDDTVDAVVVIQAPQDWFLPASLAEVLAETAGLHQKPVIASIMGKASVDEALTILHKRRIPNVAFPERAASILKAMADRRDWLEMIDRQKPYKPHVPKNRAEELVKQQKWIDLLAEYDISSPESKTVSAEKDAVLVASQIGYPVVMKLQSEKVTHKTDIDGIRIGLRNEEDLRNAWKEISEAASSQNVEMDSVLIQKMLKKGYEVIVGIKRDEQFGPMILFGTGGTDVELYKDTASAIVPLCRLEAQNLINSTIAGKKLKGWRNLPAADFDSLKQVLISMSYLAVHHPEISELEINPLYVQESGVHALDVRGSLTESSG